MQDRKHRAIGRRVDELVAMPGGGQRPGLGLPISDHAGDDQVGIIEDRAISMQQRIAEFAALMNGTRRLRGRVAWYPPWKRELPDEPQNASRMLRHLRIDFAVGSLKPGVGDHARRAVPWAGDEEDVQILVFDDPIEVDIDEIQTGGRAPVAQQARLHMLESKRLRQERVGQEVDLSDRQVVRRAPPGVHQAQLVGGERACRRRVGSANYRCG
jgi:hypothetical protein